MSITKKIAAVTIGLSLLASPAIVGGQTVEELQAQIAALLAQINALQAQLAALQGGGSQGTVSCTFTRPLYPGATGDDVNCLQRYLNSAGFQLAASGPGSPGNETNYYGPLTKEAVGKWQDANGVAYGNYRGYFGPLSQAKYNSLLAQAPQPPQQPPEQPQEEPSPEPEITTPGAEGSLTAKYAASPVDSQEVYANATGVPIFAVELKATGSDIKVDRMDILFNGNNPRAWLHIAKVHVLDGSTVLKTQDVTSANTIENTTGSSYTVRVTGLNVIVPKDTTKTLTVQIDPILQPGESSANVDYKISTNAIRGIDGAGIQQYAPSSALDARDFTVKASDKAELEVSASTDNQDEDHNVIVSSSVKTTNVPMLVMNIKSKTNGSVIRKVYASTTGSIGSTYTLKLYDGDTLVASANPSNNTVSFTDLDIAIGKDETKTLSIKMDVPKQSNVAGSASGTIKVTAASNTIVAEDATTFTSVNVTGSDVKTGKAVLFDKAPSLALANTSIEGVKPPNTASNTQWADFSITVNVTAQGGDIYVASNTSSGLLATTSVPASSSFVSGLSLTSTAEETNGGNWLVRNGETKSFTVSGRIQNTKTQQYYVRAKLQNIKWGVTDTAPTRTTQTWGLDDFKTAEILLEAKN